MQATMNAILLQKPQSIFQHTRSC